MSNQAIDQRLINLMTAGLSSELAQKAVATGYTLSKLKTATKKELAQHFERWEVDKVYTASRRAPIPEETIQQLVVECDWKCCICWNFENERPVIIHHIIEHSKTRDDSYDNLVVLCLHHHGLAHSEWKISRHPLPPELIKQRKQAWIKAISEYKAGLRPAPGTEGLIKSPFLHSDVEALKRFRLILNRPAMRQPFHVEGNMEDFLIAINDIIRAINTGILNTREGVEIDRTKPQQELSNPEWRQKMDIILERLENLRTRPEVAIRNGELQIDPKSGWYAFNNRGLPDEIDDLRNSIVRLFNQLMSEADLEPIRGIMPIRY